MDPVQKGGSTRATNSEGGRSDTDVGKILLEDVKNTIISVNRYITMQKSLLK